MLLALALVGFGALELVSALSHNWHEGGDALLTAIGYVVIALAVFDVAKYFVEEEVIRSRSLVTTSDVRRSPTKLISTIAIAVFIEGLVIVFQVSKHDVAKMSYPTALLATAILIVLGLGAYQRLNVQVERQVDRKDNAEQFTAKLDAAAETSSTPVEPTKNLDSTAPASSAKAPNEAPCMKQRPSTLARHLGCGSNLELINIGGAHLVSFGDFGNGHAILAFRPHLFPKCNKLLAIAT
jgi:hypothetical protein